MSPSVHFKSNKNDILVLGEDSTQGLADTLINLIENKIFN